MLLNSGGFHILIEVGVSVSSKKIDEIQSTILFKNKEVLPIDSFNIQLIKS